MAASRNRTQKTPESREELDDFETRARNAPEVYRFFNNHRGLAGYLAGGWAGEGLQALPEWPADIAMNVRLSCDLESGALSLQLRSHARSGGRGIRTGAARIFAGLLRRLRKGSAAEGPQFQTALEFQSDPKGSDRRAGNGAHVADNGDQNAFGPDYARLRDGDWELTVQVLENIRAHVQLRRLGGSAPIYFSGVLHKQC